MFYYYSHVCIVMFLYLCLLSFVSPINFLRSFKSNRFAIAATFGATASACLDLLWKVNQFFPTESSHVWKGTHTFDIQYIKHIHISIIYIYIYI